MTAAEAYLLGRSNAVLTFSNMQGEGGQNPSRHIGIREELARICPHFGPFYSYYLDLRGGASVGMQSYLDSGYAMAGNPFVNLGLDLSAPSGTISGRVVASRAGDPVAGFYVGAYRAGLSYGRVRTGPDGSYALRCLPPGEFDVRLNVNGMDGNTQRVTAAASATARADWKVGPLWRLSGQVLNERGEPGGNCWAEMAAGPGASDFVKTRDYGLRTSSRGLFEAWGEKPGDVWLIGRSGRQFDSPPLKVTIQPGETRQGISLRVASSTAPGPARSRSAEALMKAAASASAAVAPRPTYSPTADTRSVWVGVVPVTKQPPKRFARRPAYPHFLRIGLQVGADIPVPPVGNTETYSILIDTLGGHARPGEGAFPATHRIHLLFSRMAGHWTAKLAGRDARLDTTDASVAGARIFVDVYPLSGGPMVNWRFYASATVIGGGLKNAKFAPEKGWYRLNADLGPRPSVRLTEETPPQAVKRRRR
jgi:hypothetical protein